MAKEECQLCRNTADESGQRIWFSSRTAAGGGGESSINVISVLNQHFWFQVQNGVIQFLAEIY